MNASYWDRLEAFEGVWFNYTDNSPMEFLSRERAEFYLGKFQAKTPERNLRIVEDD